MQVLGAPVDILVLFNVVVFDTSFPQASCIKCGLREKSRFKFLEPCKAHGGWQYCQGPVPHRLGDAGLDSGRFQANR